MKSNLIKSWPIIVFLIVFVLLSGCSDKEKNEATSAAPENNIQQSTGTPAQGNIPPEIAEAVKKGEIAAIVDGKVLKKSELEKNVKERMKIYKEQIPADKRNEAQQHLRNQFVDAFVIRTLLENEFAKRKINATNDEVVNAMNNIKATLPPTKTIDDFLKENKITQEDIVFAVKAEKFRKVEIGQKAKPTQKEINKFYNENREKLFVEPESVHVRHILAAFGKDSNDKAKAEKKEKMENLRKQLLEGGNFAELAAKNSDCPSKEVGGDLSFIKRGQTVKAFEEAAFSQEKNAIGPVIQTEYGYHIIQVLDKKPARKVSLDEVKDKISSYLEQKKQVEMFSAILDDLRKKAHVEIFK